MADENKTTNTTVSGNSNTGLAFIVGGLVVVVGFLAFFLMGGDVDDDNDVSISIEGAGEAVENAAESVGNAAQEATDGN